MIARLPMRGVMPQPPLERLIARHGALPVIFALIRAMVAPQRPKARATNVADISAHLRRDVGLPPPVDRPTYWNHL